MDDETHLRLLGEATRASHQLELCTTNLLAAALNIPGHSARLLVDAMSQNGVLSVLDRLAQRLESGRVDAADLRTWVAQARRANLARNHVIHTPWLRGGPDEGVAFVVTRRSMDAVRRSEADLRRDIEVLTSTVDAAVQLLRRSVS